ncbi:MAG: hypothetical protein UU48_C0003G0066 [Candidatus Uhrbacteria bacterium GW2011_GWF2_41_16]|uniref:Fibronectin type-III domain-containing protein n=2 Tax=Candidatus Uhriibacteriota TaxID=1752732 RepID=A0A0G0VBV4_9BACT|nr:MAG: hypothetical protein UU31_C0010G0002 [Candidatus Uhrbacteria bacterium GW2011_GWA2_41_10]KKR87439.1 MAG: hypothetical protein UU35_C0003G0066 [Candidatus Uhrbacteria bacterium GW2011_GWC2_41_11]KKR98394.1 MAG: hypothetical protein UU48_C0003G0066 [Candidatus Uhrbacteria bacterium GW2011_GWF2_41_16]HBP00508.1 hypothetical protein [Candidatus Uhrbacteria bacterium]
MAIPRNFIWNVVSITVIATALVAAVSGKAATVTSANDRPTSLETGADANHTMFFTTSTGAVEGSTITLSFNSNFDTSTISEDDIDFFDDGLDLTTAPTCAGAEQASAVIAADIVTLTICPGDGGAIAPGSEITIEIGTQTTANGIGTNQITNPSDLGTVYVSIGGTFGDSGSIALPILATGAVSVSADVDQEIGGGGGGPIGGASCGDRTSPIIENIIVSDLRTSSAKITWETDESADAKLDYGYTTSYELGIQTQTSLISFHTIDLSGLLEGTTYHFRIRSADLCGNEVSSSDLIFTTLDETAPTISNIEIVDLLETSARIIWKTNEKATSTVSYGKTELYGFIQSDSTLTTDHSILLTGLSAETSYHFSVQSMDASGNTSFSADQTFTTTVNPPPENVSNLSIIPADGKNTLTWDNPPNENLEGILILACLNTFPNSPVDADCTKVFDGLNEEFIHKGLANGTTYYYGIFAHNHARQYASGALVLGTPIASIIPVEVPPEEPGEEIPIETPTETDGTTLLCGDAICSIGETSLLCPNDCILEEESLLEEEQSTTPLCGNGICEETENILLCETDCPTTKIPPEEKGEGTISYEGVSFLVADGVIQLQPDSDQMVDLLAETTLRIHVFLPSSIRSSIKQVFLLLGSQSYLFAERRDNMFETTVRIPTGPEHIPLVVLAMLEGQQQTLTFTAHILAPGFVYETLEQEKRSINDVTLVLEEKKEEVFLPWDASPFHQFNPISTKMDGVFSWYVPNGIYRIRIEKNGFEPMEIETNITNHIIHPEIHLTRIPLVELPEIVQTIASLPPVQVIKQAVSAINSFLETARAIPEVQMSAEAAIPAVTTTAIVSGIILTTAFDLIPFLQYFFTSPALFLWRRKRRGFGIVYHAVTKIPVDLAIVRLYRVSDGRLVRSRVTDKGGRYFFLVQPGEYRITVTKQGMTFPSSYLAEAKDDVMYLDVYHGELIKVTEKDATITPNIPLDSLQDETIQIPTHVHRMRQLRRLQQVTALLGVFVAAYVVLIRPTIFHIGMVGIQMVFYLLANRLAKPRKPKNWGIVYDKKTKHPLSNVVVRIFEPKYNKLLETDITDNKGRYSFLLGPNEYYSTFEKMGFQPFEFRPIDYRSHPEAVEFSTNVTLSRIISSLRTSPETSEKSAASKSNQKV